MRGTIGAPLFVDERGRALDLHDLDLRARLEHLVGHVRARRPLLAADAHAAARAGRRAAARRRARPRARRCRCEARQACAGARARAGAARRATRADAATKTTSCSQSAPRRATAATAAATAASATGPRKKRPGVKISPTASSNAAIAQASHAATIRV